MWATIWVIQCPHMRLLSIGDDDARWCDECKDWIVGKEAGQIELEWKDDGTIVVRGDGYAEITEGA